MTRLGKPVPDAVTDMRRQITECCRKVGYKVVDANSQVTGQDFLIKIWKLIVASPLAVGIAHEDIPPGTQANIYYELGVAQAMGKETVIVKSLQSTTPSDFVRSEYIEFNGQFKSSFNKYLHNLTEQAKHYETVADQLDRNPLLALDYIKRAYLITGDGRLKKKARSILKGAKVEHRATNSVEMLAASF